MSSYHHGDLKTALISEGLRLLDEEGYEALSLRKVAKACNVSQTAPYRHFKDKNELVLAIALRALESFNASLSGAVDRFEDDIRSQLLEMGVCYVRFFVENPAILRILFLNNPFKFIEGAPQLFERVTVKQHPFSTFLNAIKRYRQENPEDTRSEDEMILTMWGKVHGIAVLLVNRNIQLGDDYLTLVRRVLGNDDLFRHD